MAIVVGVPVRAAPLRLVQPPLAKNPDVRSLRRGVVGRGSCDPLRAPCSNEQKNADAAPELERRRKRPGNYKGYILSGYKGILYGFHMGLG